MEHRVAPTAKLPDDATYPTPLPAPSPMASIPHVSRPMSQPGMSQPPLAHLPTPVPGSLPPAYGSLPPRPASEPPLAQSVRSPAASFARTTPRAQAAVRPSAEPAHSSASGSIALPRRPIGLIVLVLLLDLALAGTGAVLLVKGLSAKSAATAPAPASTSAPASPSDTASASAPPAPAPAAPATAPAPAPAPLAPAAAPAPAATPAAEVVASKHPDTREARTTRHETVTAKKPPATGAAGGGGTAPLDPDADPYADPHGAVNASSLANEVDLAATRSAAELARCRDDASGGAVVHGLVKVAFQVTTDGRTAHAAAVQNTTGLPALGNCVAAVIARWTFAVHPAQTASFVRPFSYP